jgi:protein-L-isoaspartate(D-aspartate) O-methyltransferase
VQQSLAVGDAERMVREQIAARGVVDPRVLAAMRVVPRDRFVPRELRAHAWDDGPLSIGEGQTISQPYIVAIMAAALALSERDVVLEVGGGCGYSAAVLSCLTARVYTIERHQVLAERARATLTELHIGNVEVRHGDGSLGWPEHAPFSAISVAAAAREIPPALLTQLAVGGRLVIPVGSHQEDQQLLRITRTDERAYARESLGAVRFVPLIQGP